MKDNENNNLIQLLLRYHGRLSAIPLDSPEWRSLRKYLKNPEGLTEVLTAQRWVEFSVRSKKVKRTTEQMREIANVRHEANRRAKKDLSPHGIFAS
jgi:hypothetical protein